LEEKKMKQPKGGTQQPVNRRSFLKKGAMAARAVATIASFTADGLFVGQSAKFLQTVNQLAEEADAATRLL
jgi:hypothetical protein